MKNSITLKGVCVIGASGFLGSAIIDELKKREINWIGIARKESKNSKIKQISSFNNSTFSDLIAEFPFVINAMGSMRPKDFELDTKTVLDEFWTNINKLQSLLYNTKINKFLQISSAGTIYGEYNKSPSKETDIPNPISWYGRAKVLEELYYQNFAQIQNIDFLCTRVTNPYGNIHKTDHGFIDVLINSIINKKVFRTFVDENHSRDFIYAPDMAYMIVEFLLSGHTGTLNVASGNTIQLSKIIDYVQSINKSFKPNKDLVSLDFDVNNNKIDISHLKSLSLHRETNNIFDYIDANLRGLQHVQENKKYFE